MCSCWQCSSIRCRLHLVCSCLQALEENPPPALVALQTRLAALYPEYVICHMPADVLSVQGKGGAQTSCEKCSLTAILAVASCHPTTFIMSCCYSCHVRVVGDIQVMAVTRRRRCPCLYLWAMQSCRVTHVPGMTMLTLLPSTQHRPGYLLMDSITIGNSCRVAAHLLNVDVQHRLVNRHQRLVPIVSCAV